MVAGQTVGIAWTNNVAVLWVRVHNTILTDAQLTQNWNADKWRIGVSG
jgi:hypothetical protein